MHPSNRPCSHPGLTTGQRDFQRNLQQRPLDRRMPDRQYDPVLPGGHLPGGVFQPHPRFSDLRHQGPCADHPRLSETRPAAPAGIRADQQTAGRTP